ncbi:MAG: translocation/assembly module TamB domain-containing protein [Nitrospirae bacterium]|nr:translocation/assembly module TamB domain-containing protein [Nitrospirota bacterium]
MQGKFIKRLIIIFAAIFAGVFLYFIFRGPYLSNSAKRIIIPVLENATQERIIIDNAVVNAFPFYIQAKGLKMFDRDGNRLLLVTRARAYIDLLGLLTGDIKIRKLTVKEPNLTVDEEELKRIMGSAKAAPGQEEKYKVSLKNIELSDGKFSFNNAKGLTVSGKGLSFEMSTKKTVTAQMLLDEITLSSPDITEIKGGLDGKFNMEKDRIDIDEIKVKSSRSNLNAKGWIRLAEGLIIKDGSFTGNAEIYEDTVRKFLNLKTEKEGMLSFEGRVDMAAKDGSSLPVFTVDLKTDSRFYLETLMEILKVKDNFTGKVSVKGKIKGTFPELTGDGAGGLEKAMLETLPIDSAEGKLKYENKKFSLKEFTARTYGGELRKGDASISIPEADYSVAADISGISSPEFFKYIGWEPPFPQGQLGGHFKLTHIRGGNIAVTANVNYLNTSKTEGDVLNRLQRIKGDLDLKENVLEISNAVFSTAASNLSLDGILDFDNNIMWLDLLLESKDASDLTVPYYSKLSAPVRFAGAAKGPLKDPEISGKLESVTGSVHGIMFTKASADLKYRVRSLAVNNLNITHGKSSCAASGTIEFRGAKGLFSFKDPSYKAKALVKDIDIKPFISALYKDIPVTGTASGSLEYEGDSENYIAKGNLVAVESMVYGQQFTRITVNAAMDPKGIDFNSVTAQNGDSALTAKGTLSFDKKFSLSASSDKMHLYDINMFKDYPVDATFSMDIKGSGAVEKPDMKFSMRIIDSMFRGIHTGLGEVTGEMKEKNITAKGVLLNGAVSADARVSLSKNIAWDVDVDVHRGRYDFLLAGFYKNVPKDLALSLGGNAKINGEGKNYSLSSKFNFFNLTLYGYDFRNSKDVVLNFADNMLLIKSLSLTGDNGELSAEGDLSPGRQFNVKVKGNLNLAPLKAFSDKLVSLRGQGMLDLVVSGFWEKPEITGDVNINDAIASLKEYPYKVGPVNGTLFLKRDRATFDSVQAGFGGGTAVMSGVVYVQELSVKRIYVSSQLSGINIRPVEKVSATVDGRLFYEMSPKGSTLSGNIDIIKARYEKNIEWNKWLIGLKEVSSEPVNYPAFLKGLELNVHISGADNIVIDNNIAKTPIKISVNLTGNVTNYGLIGRIEANEGVIYFRSNEFKLLEGSIVDFVDSNRIVPVFHIMADTYVGEYYVKLNLDGTIDKFTLSLFSDPPLNEMEILTLLTAGQLRKETKGFESGIAAGEAASILTEGLQDVVGEKFKSITGIERFYVEPYTTATGSLSPKVTIGKRLLEDKLFVTYSTSIGTTEESVIKLEYKLDKNVSLVGSRDEIGSVGGDLKFRFEFK